MAIAKKRVGFTLVEMLVVIVIIAMLAGMIAPAILYARAKARVTECADHLKNLGEAAVQGELQTGAFPGYANKVPGTYTHEAGWPVMLLKNLNREDVWNEFREGTGTDARIDLFVCPSDNDAVTGPALSYVANCGQQPDKPITGGDDATVSGITEYLGVVANRIPPDWPANGICFRLYTADLTAPTGWVKVKVSTSDITDGIAYTFLFSERIGVGEWNASPAMEKQFGFFWNQAIEPSESAGINSDLPPWIPPSKTERLIVPRSGHPGGVNVAYCDGRVRFVDQNVEYKIYALQMSSNGSEVWLPGVAKGVYDPPQDVPGEPPAWCREPLSK